MSMAEKGLRRLMKELGEIQRMQHHRDSTFTAELVNDNLFEWHVRLHKIDPESELAADMRELEIPHILLHVIFPENFPFAPPFMRVISPRIEKGFVMEGGAICMELLTPRGWASAYTVEAVITQFAASIVKGRVSVASSSCVKNDAFCLTQVVIRVARAIYISVVASVHRLPPATDFRI